MHHDLASMIKEKKLFLLDIDGTVALGSELLPGAADFLNTVKESGGNGELRPRKMSLSQREPTPEIF